MAHAQMNEAHEKIDPLPSYNEVGVGRRITHPFKNERNISFWYNVTIHFVEEGGMVLSIYDGERILQFIMREQKCRLACVVENVH